MIPSKWSSKKGKISIYGNESQHSDYLWMEYSQNDCKGAFWAAGDVLQPHLGGGSTGV